MAHPLTLSIGTPLSPSATRVMLLGSGELRKEVITALPRLGIETIAVDRYPNAPGHPGAPLALSARDRFPSRRFSGRAFGAWRPGVVFRSRSMPARHRHGDALRLLGKPEAYKRRRMGVALASADVIEEARMCAKECAIRVTTRA